MISKAGDHPYRLGKVWFPYCSFVYITRLFSGSLGCTFG
jgi:hypothetical protein